MEDIRTFIQQEKNLAEDFLKSVCPDEIIILCGNGAALYWYYKFLINNGVKPDYIIDKNIRESEQKFGIPVVSYTFIVEHMNPEICRFVVTAPRYRDEIIQDIQKAFGNARIDSFEAEIYCNFIRNIHEYRNILTDHYEKISELYEWLEDSKSKETLIHFIKGRISGNQKYFSECMDPNAYFPEDILSIGAEDVIVEAGSYDGQTLEDMIIRTDGCFKKIYCFEPDRECIPVLERIIQNSDLPIELIKKGVGTRKETLYFKADPAYGTSRVVNDETYDYAIDVTSIDEELNENITYIKMDIEGMELDCLKGGGKNNIVLSSQTCSVCISS